MYLADGFPFITLALAIVVFAIALPLGMTLLIALARKDWIKRGAAFTGLALYILATLGSAALIMVGFGLISL